MFMWKKTLAKFAIVFVRRTTFFTGIFHTFSWPTYHLVTLTFDPLTFWPPKLVGWLLRTHAPLDFGLFGIILCWHASTHCTCTAWYPFWEFADYFPDPDGINMHVKTTGRKTERRTAMQSVARLREEGSQQQLLNSTLSFDYVIVSRSVPPMTSQWRHTTREPRPLHSATAEPGAVHCGDKDW